jgi:protein gp37
MADKTGIEWTEATWNPLVGCSVVSPGCKHCYAARDAGRRLASNPKYRGLTLGSEAGPVWTGEVRLWEDAIDRPLHWEKPRRIFVNSMSDLFHESVPEQWIDRIFGIMALASQHTFQVLTKRAARMRAWFAKRREHIALIDCVAEAYVDQPSLAADWPLDLERAIALGERGWPLPNVWLGVSVEDRARLPRIDELRLMSAAVRFVSFEPLLEDLGPLDLHGIDWVICGGETGPRARPMHPDWARALRDQCQAARVPFFFKQWGEWAPAPEEMNFAEGAALAGRHSREFEQSSSGHTLIRVGRKAAGRLLDGVTWDEAPA